MGKPDKRLKKIFLILGVTGAVYGTFRFLLPLVIPFLLAWALALLLRPSAEWMAARCRFSFSVRSRKLRLQIPVGIIGGIELLMLLTVAGAAVYQIGKLLYLEAMMLLDRLPGWVSRLDVWLTGVCHRAEVCFCLRPNTLVVLTQDMLRSTLVHVRQAAMPQLVGNSVGAFRHFFRLMVLAVLTVIAAGLFLQEMHRWKKRIKYSMFSREFEIIGERLSVVVNAYLKTQLILLVLISAICMAGLWMMKNPYYLLAGLGIGVFDALPIFGSGMILVPWAVICFLRRSWWTGLGLLVLYLLCYLLREILEAKMMGAQVGLSSLEILVSVYVGLKLFGFAGILLGPVGLLLIEDFVELCEGMEEEDKIGS